MARNLLPFALLAWGVAWAVRCAIGAFEPDYYSPVTTLDYAAVWTYSAALGLSAAVAVLAALLSRSRPVGFVGVVSGAGFAIAAVANGLEDGFALRDFGAVYVPAAAAAALGAALFTVSLLIVRLPMLAALAAMLLLPVPFVASWLGVGVLVPAAWAARRLARDAGATPVPVEAQQEVRA